MEVAYSLDQFLSICWKLPYIIALLLQALQDLEDGAKHIQVGCSAYVAFVRWEAEDCDCQLLLSVLFLLQPARCSPSGTSVATWRLMNKLKFSHRMSK